MELTTNAAIGTALLNAVQAHDLKQVRAIARAVEAQRQRQWRLASLRSQGGFGENSGPGFVSLDAPVTPSGITGFHLACKAWQVHRDLPVSAACFDRMAEALLKGGASPFAAFGPRGNQRTIFEELGRGVVPPSVQAWMAEQRFDELQSPSERTHLKQTRPSQYAHAGYARLRRKAA